jgi:hypothetical protein
MWTASLSRRGWPVEGGTLAQLGNSSRPVQGMGAAQKFSHSLVPEVTRESWPLSFTKTHLGYLSRRHHRFRVLLQWDGVGSRQLRASGSISAQLLSCLWYGKVTWLLWPTLFSSAKWVYYRFVTKLQWSQGWEQVLHNWQVPTQILIIIQTHIHSIFGSFVLWLKKYIWLSKGHPSRQLMKAVVMTSTWALENWDWRRGIEGHQGAQKWAKRRLIWLPCWDSRSLT